MTAPLPHDSTGVRLVTIDGRDLPLTATALTATAHAGLARVTLVQTFVNPYPEPLKVTYSLPLPADGAVSAFAFTVGDERVEGRVETRARARERFEDAILEGRTAALLEQARAAVFTQELGNVPGGGTVTCEVGVDQPLRWLSEGAWEWRFPTVVAPRYLGEPGRVPDAAAVTVDVAGGPLPVRATLRLAVRDALSEGARCESPSHRLHGEQRPGEVLVELADPDGARLDRDVVVRWRVARPAPRASLEVVQRDGRTFGLVTVVPPAPGSAVTAVPRDLIVLLDTSGSMGGAPLDQARRLTAALVDSLTDADRLELIEFSSRPRRWKQAPVPATAKHRKDAQAWLARLQASGGTEMRTGILEALAPLRDGAQRQVVLITDGLIGFEDEVVEAVARRLPASARVHTVGVGSGVNRGLTRPVARAGRGVEVVLGLGEDVEVAVRRLLERTVAPVWTQVELGGEGLIAVAPKRVPDLYGGAPAMACVELRGPGPVTLRAHAASGPVHLEVPVSIEGQGREAVAALFARERVEDLELDRAAGGDRDAIDRELEAVGLSLQIATRLTSWVAVSRSATVDPRAPRRTEVMPHELPDGMSAEGVGLRPVGAAFAALAPSALAAPPSELAMPSVPARSRSPRSPAPAASHGLVAREAVAPFGVSQDRGGDDELAMPAERDRREEERRERPPAKKKDAGASTRTGAGRSPRTLAGRVVRRARGRLTVTFTVTGSPLAWLVPARAVVEAADGTTRTVAVIAERSTTAGTVQPGLELTVVLGEDVPCARIHLELGGEWLTVEV